MIEKILMGLVLDDNLKAKLQKDMDRCLRKSNDKTKCNLCVEICPEQAIEERDEGVKVDDILCTGCNLCVSVCYSRVFRPENTPYLISLNELLDKDTSIWYCRENKKEEGVNFGCLKTVDPRFLEALIFSGLNKKVLLDLTHCKDCQYKDLAWPNDRFFEIRDSDFSFGEYEEKKPEVADEKVDLSRRDFFRSFSKYGESVKKTTLKETTRSLGLDLTSEEDMDALIKILLRRGLRNEETIPISKEYIYSLRSNSKCTLCRECTYYCPNNSISYYKNATSSGLKFDPETCNFCGRCIDKCPENALYKDEFRGLDSYVMKSFSVSRCKGCRVKTSHLNEDGYCMTCAIRRKNRKI